MEKWGNEETYYSFIDIFLQTFFGGKAYMSEVSTQILIGKI